MSRIRGRDTKPELLLRSALWRRGLRFRTKNRLRGRPDIVFPTERIAVFVDGCFWHRCPEHQTKPAANAEFWDKKLSGNVERDRRADEILQTDGWSVVRIWEHEVERDLEAVTGRVQALVLEKRATRKDAAGQHAGRGRRARRQEAR